MRSWLCSLRLPWLTFSPLLIDFKGAVHKTAVYQIYGANAREAAHASSSGMCLRASLFRFLSLLLFFVLFSFVCQ